MTGWGGRVGEELETQGVGSGEGVDWGRVDKSSLTHCFSFNPLPESIPSFIPSPSLHPE